MPETIALTEMTINGTRCQALCCSGLQMSDAAQPGAGRRVMTSHTARAYN
jgi:hypothetical protein